MPTVTSPARGYPGVTPGLQARVILQSLEPGVIFESHLGWHIHYMVVDLAVSAGFRITYFERIQLDLYRDGSHELAPAQREAAMMILDPGNLVDRAVGYLNEFVAKPPHRFGFYAEDFAYLPDTMWEAQA